MEPEPPPPADASDPPRPSLIQGIVYGLFAAISLGVILSFIVVLSHRTGCDPRVVCVTSEAMLRQALIFVAVTAAVFGLIMGALAAFVLPRVSANMGSGCAVILGLGVICLCAVAMMVPALEMLESMLWG